MGLKRNRVILEIKQKDSSLLEILRLDGDACFFLKFTQGSFLCSLTRLDLSSESNKGGSVVINCLKY